MQNKELTVIEKEVSPLIQTAENLEIINADTMKASAELLSQCNNYLDNVTKDREKITKPLNVSLKEIRAKYKPLETILETAIDILREKQSHYQTRLVNENREKQAKLAARLEKGTLKMETAVKKIEELQKPDELVQTESGDVAFREIETLHIIDTTNIPHEYFDLNQKRVLEALKTGAVIPGVEILIVQMPVNYRK